MSNNISVSDYFGKQVKKYEDYAHIQKISSKYLSKLLEKYKNTEVNSILEIGCGSGLFTRELINKFPNAQISCIDNSQKIIDFARQNFTQNINFILTDFNKYKIFRNDMIVSNLSLQWMDNLTEIVKNCSQNSKYFSFSIPLNSSFENIKKIYLENDLEDTFLNFPSIEKIEYLCALTEKRFDIHCEKFTIDFPNLFLFLKNFKDIGANFSTKRNKFSKIKPVLDKYNSEIKVNYDIAFVEIYD